MLAVLVASLVLSSGESLQLDFTLYANFNTTTSRVTSSLLFSLKVVI